MNSQEEIYFLVGVKLPHDDLALVEDSMRELEGLVTTAGGTIAGSMIQNRQSVDAAYYIGKGKVQEIDILFDKFDGQNASVVFNASLSPSQVSNLEEILECRVITRTELILDIFAIHAHTKIAKLQVETAQLAYILPRLTGNGSSLSRTGGGIGTRGPGETKLETDRRKIRNRLVLLRRELKSLEKSFVERRKTREDIFKIAVAGYTNAGKSALSAKLTKQNLYVQDKLFATVDTTTKRLVLGGVEAVLTDTVGFIRDIPHELVDSFHSTLAETVSANLILHIVDLSSHLYEDKIETAEKLLHDIKVESPIILVFNKIDLVDSQQVNQIKTKYPDAFFISVKNEEGFITLKRFLQNRMIQFLKDQGKDLSTYQFLI